MSAGKGDSYRPVNNKVYGENYDAIDWTKTLSDGIVKPEANDVQSERERPIDSDAGREQPY